MINREIRAFGVDDHAFAAGVRGFNDAADDMRGENALSVVRQQNDIGARQSCRNRLDQLRFNSRSDRCGDFPIGAKHMGREVFGDEPQFPRRLPRAISNQQWFDQRLAAEFVLQGPASLIVTDQPDKNTFCAERGDVARDVAGATDIDLAALNRNDRRRRLRRDPRHLAIDKLVEHQVADAKDSLTTNRL